MKHPSSFLKASLVLGGIALFLPAPLTALAVNPVSTAATSEKLREIKTKGDTDVTVRIQSLNNLINKINATTRLTAEQKNSLTQDIQAEITSLTTLKAKIDADPDVDLARTDFQNIFKQHFVYAFYIPRMHRILAADAELQTAAQLQALIPQLQGFINQAKQQGTETTALQAALTDLQTRSQAATTSAQAVITTLLALKAQDHPGNASSMRNANAGLKEGRSQLKAARADLTTITTGLKKALHGLD